MKLRKNEQGQGLIEYLILTAIIAIATMGVVRIVGHTVSAKFADIANSIRGEDFNKAKVERVEERHYRKKDMSDFMQGTANKKRSE
ncbi:MAG: Flp family type IVb pilin [Bdellovibrionales bacterium]|nr:Flp family type IVb pilin [Bdellovibrionales bacterium]